MIPASRAAERCSVNNGKQSPSLREVRCPAITYKPGSQAVLGQHWQAIAKPPRSALPGDYLGVARQMSGHVGQYVCQHSQQRGVLFEVRGIHFVHCVGLGVMPVEIMLDGGGRT
jgi:hypothetical protein